MGRRILVLDDDSKVVELITLILKRAGHEVEGVTSYESAVESLSRLPAELMVSDLNMPGVGGLTGIRSLSRKRLIRRALVVSGYIDAQAQAQIAATPEVVGYLEKPFDIHELARLVRAHVDLPAPKENTSEA